jgi:hypothetical protein
VRLVLHFARWRASRQSVAVARCQKVAETGEGRERRCAQDPAEKTPSGRWLTAQELRDGKMPAVGSRLVDEPHALLRLLLCDAESVKFCPLPRGRGRHCRQVCGEPVDARRAEATVAIEDKSGCCCHTVGHVSMLRLETVGHVPLFTGNFACAAAIQSCIPLRSGA